MKQRIQRDVQVDKNDPGDDDRQTPFGTLEFGADVVDWSRVVRVNVELDVLEIRGVVEHEEHQAKREKGIGDWEAKLGGDAHDSV